MFRLSAILVSLCVLTGAVTAAAHQSDATHARAPVYSKLVRTPDRVTASAASGAAIEVSIPELASWELHMITYGQVHCYLGPLDHVYYDAERVYYQIAAYTGDFTWTTCADFAEITYRDQYVLPNNGSVPGYWNFTTGLRLDYDRTRDSRSKDAAILLSQNAAYAHDRPLEWTASADYSREVAYAIVSYINAEALGEPKRQRRIDLVNQAYDHMAQWFVRFAWPGPWQQSPQETARLAPFMVGLTAHALIRDWEQTEDTRLIPALRRAADWMWANAWVAVDESMWYESLDRSKGAPDLNLLIAPIYAFLYHETGETKYRDEGDALFAGGVRRAYLAGGKQFDQNYWWSFDYVTWRKAPAPDTSAPAVIITAPAAGDPVGGLITVSANATDNVGVSGVQFKVNGANLGAEDTTAPYAVTWDTTKVVSGPYTLTAVARDAAGNAGASPPVTVTVINDTTPPVISGVSTSDLSASSATISWTTDEPSDSQVDYGVTTAYGSVTSLDRGLVTAHAQRLSGLAAGTVYHYRVRSRDAWGNVAVSPDLTFATPAKKGRRVGHWGLNEGTGTSTADASGSGLTGTLVNGPTWTPGKAGAAVGFDGENDYVEIPHAPALNGYPLTVAAWIKTVSTTGVRGIVNKYVAGSFDGWNLFLNDGNLCAWYLRDTASYVYGGGGCTFSVPGYNDNRWHHVAYVVDADGGRFYVDGVLRGSLGWTGTPGAPSTTQPLHLGHYPGAYGGAEYFPGLLDDVRVYDGALTAAEVMALYRGIGAVGIWPLDEGTGSSAVDVSDSGFAGTLANGATWTAGRLGTAVALDGVDDHVEVPHAPALNAYPLTVAAWIKTTSTTGVRGLVNKYVAGSFNGWNLFLNDGRLCAWYLRDSANSVYGGGGCTFNLAGYNDGQWHHVAYLIDAAGGRLYVDGALKGSLGWTGNPGPPSTTQPVRLGHYPGAYGGAEYFPGVLDDVRLYSRALSGDEILALYNAAPSGQ